MFALRLSFLLLAALLFGCGLLTLLRRAHKTPAQRESARRRRLAAMGRIAEGTIVNVCELPAPPGRNGQWTAPIQLLVFSYDVSGVTYEASQDITRLRHYVDLHACRHGLQTSVKYDPLNPGNSIVVAEGWNGLRMQAWPQLSAPNNGAV